MSDLIGRSKVLEELIEYENELRKDKTEAIETDDENMLFAIMNQLTAICRIKRNILNMPTSYDIDKVVEELKELEGIQFDGENESYQLNWCIETNRAIEIIKHGGDTSNMLSYKNSVWNGGASDDVCEWYKVKNRSAFKCNTHAEIYDSRVLDWRVCPYCLKKVKVVGD